MRVGVRGDDAVGNLGVWRQVWLLMHITVYHKKSECMFVSVDTVMAPGRLVMQVPAPFESSFSALRNTSLELAQDKDRPIRFYDLQKPPQIIRYGDFL